MKIQFFLFFLVLFFSFASATSEFPTNLIVVDSTSLNPSIIYPGDMVSIKIDLKNRGIGTTANNLTVISFFPKEFESIKSNDLIGFFPTNSTRTAVLSFKVGKKTIPSTYSIPLKIVYKREDDDKNFVIDQNIAVDVKGFYSLDLTNINVDNVSSYIGDAVKINGIVKNIGSFEARNVQVVLEPDGFTTFGNIIPLTENSLRLGNISIDDSRQINFSLFLGKETSLGVYNYKLTVSQLDSNNRDVEKISFEVKDKPEIVLSGVDFSVQGNSKEKKLLQGSNFSLSIQLDNIGKTKAKAVELKLDLPEGFSGSKNAFLGNIDPNDSSSALFDLSILPSVKQGSYNAKILISFFNELDEKVFLEKSIELFVYEKPPENPIFLLLVLAVVLLLVYLILRLLLRYFVRNKFAKNSN